MRGMSGGRARGRRRAASAAVAFAWTCLSVSFLAAPAPAATPGLLHARIVGEPITPVIADFLREGVARAEQGYEAFVVELDTPGGLDTSMREIVQAFLTARAPVIVYVPPGGRAASAGAIIASAAHLIAMAPASTIGAATPVDLQGGDIGQKIINDAAAFAQSIAATRGRNVTFAADIVLDARVATAEEAQRIGAVDLVAPTLTDALAAVDGRTVRIDDATEVTLRTDGVPLTTYDLSFLQRVRQRLADPNIAFLFLSIGTLAIIYELAQPGVGAGGFVGVILIVLAMFSLSVLPVNVTGVLLLLLAAALFIGEVFTAGLGVLAAGGVAALILSGLFLFRGSVGVSIALLIPTAAVVGGGVLFATRLAWRARRAPTATGSGLLVGKVATVRTEGAQQQVFLEGAWWRIRAEQPLRAGQRVHVVAMEGLDLIVEPVPEPAGSSEEGERWKH